MDMNLIKLHGLVKHWEAWHEKSVGLQRVGHDLATEQHGVIVIKTITITTLTPTIHRTVTGGAGAKLQEYHLDSETDKDDADLGYSAWFWWLR